MTTRSLLLLTVLVGVVAAPLVGCIAGGSSEPYDRSDQYKNSNGTEQMGAPGSGARD